jgi:hypothetical protein
MNNIEFILQFSILPYKYIILYIDNEIFNEDINTKLSIDIKNINNNLNIIRFLSKNEFKQKLNLNQIYTDSFTEDILIKYCLCIIYLSKINRSEILINLIDLYNKYIIFEQDKIISNINYIIYNNIEKLTVLNKDKNIFKENYSSLKLNKKLILERNIKIECNKIFKEYKNINNDNYDKINIITYFKYFELKILNEIQKKCIIENLENKNVSKVIVLGNNIHVEFQDIYYNDDKNILNLELIEFNKDITYKNLLDFSNKLNKNTIVCILRSDIILLNQNEIKTLNIDLQSFKNEIYALTRTERLINGNFIESEKSKKNFFSTDQDAWIFKSPININTDLFDNIFFYNKYSELFFNKVLISNNYKIINNSSKIKIIRILYDNNIENRLLLNNYSIDIINNIDYIQLVPENDLINNFSIDSLNNFISNVEFDNIKYDIFNKYFKNEINNNDLLNNHSIDYLLNMFINKKEIYYIKCDIFNKFLKNKIVNELI